MTTPSSSSSRAATKAISLHLRRALLANSSRSSLCGDVVAVTRRTLRRPRSIALFSTQSGDGGAGAVTAATSIPKPPAPGIAPTAASSSQTTPPPRPSQLPPNGDDDDADWPFKISKLWLTMAALGGLGIWVFGGDAPAAYDKQKPKPNKPRTIDVAYVASSYQANKEIEDRYQVRETLEGDVFAGVFDGHGGWAASLWSSRNISHIIENEMANETSDKPDEVARALARSFERADRTLLHYFYFGVIFGFPSFARVGSCAIALLVRGRELFVANAGDCRAIMGRRLPNNSIAVVPLSRDHNARFEREKKALREAHPGEEDVVVCTHPDVCYIKNRSQATRTLGDAYLKCAEFNGRAGGRGADRRYIPPPYTPPYTTATPEVVHASLDDPRVEGAEFVVLGSDGIYDALSNQEIVNIVADAIDEGVPEEATDRLILRALQVLAEANDTTVEALKAIPPGNKRRNYHDDITVVVTYLHPAALTGSSTTSISSSSSRKKPELKKKTTTAILHKEGPELYRLESQQKKKII